MKLTGKKIMKAINEMKKNTIVMTDDEPLCVFKLDLIVVNITTADKRKIKTHIIVENVADDELKYAAEQIAVETGITGEMKI